MPKNKNNKRNKTRKRNKCGGGKGSGKGRSNEHSKGIGVRHSVRKKSSERGSISKNKYLMPVKVTNNFGKMPHTPQIKREPSFKIPSSGNTESYSPYRGVSPVPPGGLSPTEPYVSPGIKNLTGFSPLEEFKPKYSGLRLHIPNIPLTLNGNQSSSYKINLTREDIMNKLKLNYPHINWDTIIITDNDIVNAIQKEKIGNIGNTNIETFLIDTISVLKEESARENVNKQLGVVHNQSSRHVPEQSLMGISPRPFLIHRAPQAKQEQIKGTRLF